ncbi:MAG: hypothetical protein KBT01_01100, partial [Clostridiales bacterium]|nr:hypothetical protein [Candidatus Blautia equi]
MKRKFANKRLMALLLSAAMIFQQSAGSAAETDIDGYVLEEETWEEPEEEETWEEEEDEAEELPEEEEELPE